MFSRSPRILWVAAGCFAPSRACLFEIHDVREKVLIDRRRRALEKERDLRRHGKTADADGRSALSRQSPLNHTIAGEDGADVMRGEWTDEEIAKDVGIVRDDDVVDVEVLRREKEDMQAFMEAQRRDRMARRDAFYEWQAGQREKGAANRLVRQAKTAERYKRLHYQSQRHRLLPVRYGSNEESHAAAADRVEGRKESGDRIGARPMNGAQSRASTRNERVPYSDGRMEFTQRRPSAERPGPQFSRRGAATTSCDFINHASASRVPSRFSIPLSLERR